MSTEDKVRMTLRLTEEENVRLEQYAKANNLTKTGGIRQLLEMALFADEALSMDTDDSALGKLIAGEQASSIQKLIEATQIAKSESDYLTPEQSSELISVMSKLRGSVDSYVYELNKIGNNINQVARKYNATEDLNGDELVRDLVTVNDNLRGMRDLMFGVSEKVERLWHTVR